VRYFMDTRAGLAVMRIQTEVAKEGMPWRARGSAGGATLLALLAGSMPSVSTKAIMTRRAGKCGR
jgi:hypothetical protein